ncbi:MAG: NAD(P)-dependent oxidoreductase [Candidatus Thorarchaeota archaeon]|nr:NAD(P)-dependent oxidoreductase [Candidatus Thorarchaeota archaeon]
MTNCFVTGGTGFVGSHIVRQLAEKGHNVKVMARETSKLDLIDGLTYTKCIGDVTDAASLDANITEDIEWLFHNAAIMAEWGSKEKFFPVNVDGTQNILEVVRKKDIPQLMYTSSTAVYGFPHKLEPMLEDDEWAPMNYYQKSKAAAETLITEYAKAYGIKAVRIRPPTVLGRGDMFTGPQIIERLKNEEMVTFGGGKNHQSFVHGSDVAECLILAAENFEKAAGNAYNVVSFSSRFIDFLEALADEVGVERKFQNYPYKVTLGLGKMTAGICGALGREKAPLLTDFVVKLFGSNYVVSGDKVRNELDFEPKWNLASTVKDMVDWGGEVKPR